MRIAYAGDRPSLFAKIGLFAAALLTLGAVGCGGGGGGSNDGGSSGPPTSYTVSRTFGSSGSGNSQFHGPFGLALDSADNIYVVDSKNNRVQKFRSDGSFIAAFSAPSSLPLSNPTGIALDSNNTVYVADTNNGRIVKFDSSGNFLSTIGTLGRESGQLTSPIGVVVDPSGNIFVADNGNARIVEFDHTGAFVQNIGTAGLGKLISPFGLTLDTLGNLYVADESTEVQKFSATGTYLGTIGTRGTGNGQFSSPQFVAIGSDGSIYVSDSTLVVSRIEKFDLNGNFLASLSQTGSNSLNNPEGIAVDSNDLIYVSDFSNSRVVIFKPN